MSADLTPPLPVVARITPAARLVWAEISEHPASLIGAELVRKADADAAIASLHARLQEAERLLQGAADWIDAAPHGDNCYVSDHYEGDPGDRCSCGKDSLLDALHAATQEKP